jgi:fumarate hydratase class II
LEIVTAFLPAIGYERATELVQAFKDRTDRSDFRTFLAQELGEELVEKTLSPRNLMALGHRT